MTVRAAALVVVIATVTVLSLSLGLIGGHAAAAPTSVSPPGAAAPATSSAPAPAGMAGLSPSPPASRVAFEQQVLATAKSDHIPMAAVSLPNLLGQSTVTNGVVTPLYTTAPAPMGIGDWGVKNTTGTATPYTLRTTSWEGSITIDNVNTFLLDNDGALNTAGTNNTFGVQLNAVTNNSTVQDQSTDAFWTQNVFYYDLVPGYITFLDNVWNFSSPATELTSGTIYSGNGTPVYPEYYYSFGPSIPVEFPMTVHLFINSSVTDLGGIGYTTIRFGYAVSSPAGSASGVYDTVLFNSTTPYASVPVSPFLVDGSQLTPTNFLPYDAELMIGGPGGGSSVSVYGLQGSESLKYLASDGDYVNAPSAWDVATDTGETSEGVAETYTTPGTVDISAGPSLLMPFWNATPGGNIGQATLSGPLSPSNAFVFVSPGGSFNENTAAWAPTQTSSHVAYTLPPGTYTAEAMLSDHTPVTQTVSVRNFGSATLDFVLAPNDHEGVYTPLYAWNNGQLAAISASGSGTPGDPYVLDNNGARGGLNPVFSELNDYFWLVFPGVLLAGTTAPVELNQPFLNNVTELTGYDADLEARDLPLTDNLQYEIVAASDVTIWDAHGITGWFYFQNYGPTGGVPLGNVVIWDGTHDLVGDSTFISQGSSLVLADTSSSVASGNVIWGNTFLNSSAITPTMYPGDGAQNGPPIAIFAFEAGDLIYNNALETSIPAFAPDENIYTGAPQLNLESWNLPMVEPKGDSLEVNGHALSGTIVPSRFQGGNYWDDYSVGLPLPFNDFGLIASGGDAFPLPISAYEVTFTLGGHGLPVDWSVTLNGVTQTTTSRSLTFYEVPGTYAYTDAVVEGPGAIAPSSGSVTVTSSDVSVALAWTF